MRRLRNALSYSTVMATMAVVMAAPASAAAAGSIVYTKAGNIYRAHGDGSGVHRLTRDGKRSRPYKDPTQADNGTVVAVRDDMTLHRFSRAGKRLGRARRVATGVHNSGSLHDLAFAPALSPNGKQVAFQNTLLQGYYDPSTGTSGMNIIAVTIQYRSASTGKKVGERHIAGDYLESPSWVDNSHVLVFRPLAIYAAQVNVDTRGGGWQEWFSEELGGETPFDRPPLDAGELTRAGDKLALIHGTNLADDWSGATLQIYATSGFDQLPTLACTVPRSGSGPLAHPTWSPDGTTLAWSDRQGIWTTPVGTTAEGCGLVPKLTIRGGSTPDWGPA